MVWQEALLSALSLPIPLETLRLSLESPSSILRFENHWPPASIPYHWNDVSDVSANHTLQETRLPSDNGFL